MWTCIIFSICLKVFKYENDMKAHIKSHSKGNIDYVQCGKQFASEGTLKDHVATEHIGKGKFKCEEYDKTFSDEQWDNQS